MITNTIFVGKEIEGADYGDATIFIPRGVVKSCGVSKVFEKIQQLGHKRLYFGAKEQRNVDIEDLQLISKLSGFEIFAEVTPDFNLVEIPQYILHYVEWVLVIESACAYPFRHIKIQDKTKLRWYPVKNNFVTELNDKEYLKDVAYEIN